MNIYIKYYICLIMYIMSNHINRLSSSVRRDLIFCWYTLPFLSVQASEKFSLILRIILRMIRVLEKNVMVS